MAESGNQDKERKIGLALILVNGDFKKQEDGFQFEKRRGAAMDQQRLIETFSDLRFDVRSYYNLISAHMLRAAKESKSISIYFLLWFH